MKLLQRRPERPRVTPHLVERHQAEVGVEGRVLHALGHDRGRHLLEAAGQLLLHRLVRSVPCSGTDPEQQQVPEEGEQLRVELGPAPHGVGHGALDARHVLLGDRTIGRADVGPVDGEAGENLSQHLVQLVARVVTEAAVPFAHLHEEGREPAHIGGQRGPHDLVLAGVGDVGEVFTVVRVRFGGGVGFGTGDPGVEPRERLLAGGVHEQATEAVEEVVTGGACHGPASPKTLAPFQDLLHHHPGPVRRLLQPAQVTLRVPQAVGVVHPEPVHHPLSDPAQHPLVGVVEHVRVLHAQPHQAADVEEAPVSQLPGAGAPERQAVVLALEQGAQGVGSSVHGGDPGIHGADHLRVRVTQLRQPSSQDLLVAVAFPHTFAIGCGGWRETSEGCGHGLQPVALASGRGLGQ